ncbi:GntR family transcriptional regulator [Streptomyces ziwulingensis]
MRVLDALTTDSRAGEFAPGARIPSEAELCERHGAARETTHRAVRVLRERGLVVTERGKGTFVAGPAEQSEDEHQDDQCCDRIGSPVRMSYRLFT